MLTLDNLYVNYGAIRALKGFSCTVNQGEIVALIGANGAGKSTILNSISGLVPLAAGKITFLGDTISGIAPHRIVRKGISQVPEGRRVFATMTVQENLEMGGYIRTDSKGLRDDIERIFIRFPRLAERKQQLSSTLSGGEQQMLAIGRALMSRPTLLLLDEPSMGLAPMLVEQIFTIIREINAGGMTILLVEQNASMALSIASRAYVLESGNSVLHGRSADLAIDPNVRSAYLGT